MHHDWKRYVSALNEEWAKDAWYEDELAILEALIHIERGEVGLARELLALVVGIDLMDGKQIDLVHWMFAREEWHGLRKKTEERVAAHRQEAWRDYGEVHGSEQEQEREEMVDEEASWYRAYLTALLDKYDASVAGDDDEERP